MVDGGQALHVAADAGAVDVAAMLLRAHADPNAATAEGATPLVYAVNQVQVPVLQV